jgi:predicted acylesterase/phospholipase RssA
VHLGDNTAESPSGRPVHFNGWINGIAARQYLAPNFPDAEQVVVIGLSAGAIAAPLYAAAVSDQLPDARITLLDDSSGADPDAANPMIGTGHDADSLSRLHRGLVYAAGLRRRRWIQS